MFRFVHNFGEIQAQLLNFYEENRDIHIDEFYKTIVQIASSKELKDDRIEYLNCFKNQVSEKGIRTIQGNLLKNEISWDIVPVKTKSDNSRKDVKDDYFEKFNLSFQNNEEKNRENLIREGTQAFIKERVNIWLGNWSTSSNIAKSNLKKLFIDEFEVFRYLKEFINHYSSDIWSITSKLIWFLEGKLSLEKTKEIYKTITEHFSLLIRPDTETISKYDWIEAETSMKTNDELLAKFLIWFLNHPNEGFSKRAFYSIQKLAIYEPELIIPILIEEISSNEPNVSPVKCSLILRNISIEKPELIKNILEKENDCFHALVKIDHFTIKKNLLDCATNLNRIGYNNLYDEIYSSLPGTIIIVGDVALEEEYLEGISYEINELNYMQILNRKFCETLLKTIVEKCKPLSIDEFRKSDKYLKRSFPEDSYFSGRYYEVLRYSLNKAISDRVDKKSMNKVYEILNS